jgi:hypothetical protein
MRLGAPAASTGWKARGVTRGLRGNVRSWLFLTRPKYPESVKRPAENGALASTDAAAAAWSPLAFFVSFSPSPEACGPAPCRRVVVPSSAPCGSATKVTRHGPAHSTPDEFPLNKARTGSSVCRGRQPHASSNGSFRYSSAAKPSPANGAFPHMYHTGRKSYGPDGGRKCRSWSRLGRVGQMGGTAS